jgi:uncharacterized membrane protein YbhN (UPF0104 family)
MWINKKQKRTLSIKLFNRRQILKGIFGFTISGFCVFQLRDNLDPMLLLSFIKGTDKFYLLASILFIILGLISRAIRWKLFIRINGNEASIRVVGPAFLISIMLNNLFPLRLGDVVRTSYYGKKFSNSLGKSIKIILIEKVLDFTILVGIVVIVSFSFYFPEVKEFYIGGHFRKLELVGSFIILAIAMVVFVKRRFVLHKFRSIRLMIKNANVEFFTHKLSILALSIVAWVFETLVYYFAIHATGMPFKIEEAILLTAVVTLSTSIPSSPGYIGTFHLAFTQVATFLNYNSSWSVDASVLVHLVLWLISSSLGIFFLILEQVSKFQDFKRKARYEEEL